MSVVLRTHGGLGNQIFQILYGRLLSDNLGTGLCETHDSDYAHKFKRSLMLGNSGLRLNRRQHYISGMRLPKVISRLDLKREPEITLWGDVYLDGYFQHRSIYERFDVPSIHKQLMVIRQELALRTVSSDKTLVHLRVGDFFDSAAAAEKHVIARLESIPNGCSIITNNERVLMGVEMVRLLEKKDCELISTEGWQAEEVLAFMTKFAKIDANDSTLVFWAGVLGNCQVSIEDPQLEETYKLLRSASSIKKSSKI